MENPIYVTNEHMDLTMNLTMRIIEMGFHSKLEIAVTVETLGFQQC